VGIVASKLVEKWKKPVLIGQVLGASTKGSARSVPGFNMVEALRGNADLLERYGGHVFAAGWTLPTDRLGELRVGMDRGDERSGAAEFEVPKVLPEADLGDLTDVGWPLLEQLELLEPYGRDNPRPLLELRGLKVERLARIGSEGKHLRLSLSDGNGKRLAS